VNKVPITVNGSDLLRDELQQLKFVKRPSVIKAISEARAHGDLKENAEYHAAKEEQSFIEGRIKDIEGKLSNAQIIDVTTLGPTGRVVFGSTIDLVDENDGKEFTYQIVGEDESDISSGRISFQSPIARALIGKDQGDVVVVNAPGGEKEFEIIEIRYV
jgi:transcription elongation factor GreA